MISIVGDVIIVFSLIWRIQFVTSYGVDVTAPIHHMIDKEASHFAKRYYDTMQGCYDKYTKQECDSTEW